MHISAVAIPTGGANHLSADDKSAGPPAWPSKARGQRTPRRASGLTAGDEPHAAGDPPDAISRILGTKLRFSVQETAQALVSQEIGFTSRCEKAGSNTSGPAGVVA
jgi:hypothetical protein